MQCLPSFLTIPNTFSASPSVTMHRHSQPEDVINIQPDVINIQPVTSQSVAVFDTQTIAHTQGSQTGIYFYKY